MKLNFVTKGYFKGIDEFAFLKQIGVGSFGKVELALHIQTNCFYAIKIIKLEGEDLNRQELLLLEREIYLHSQIEHPHIIKLWDTLSDGKQVYMVMELAENSSLFSYQNKKRTFPETEAFKYFSQTLKAISYMHSLNTMHRDIKPENILLDKNYNVKLCDLGWATENIHQKRKTFCGTYEYMAPEMIFEKEYDFKIDVWSLGILLYELLHGCAPFKARSLDQIKEKVSKGHFELNANLSKQLKNLIVDLLQFEPEKRPSLQSVQKYSWVEKMQNEVKKQAKKIQKQLSFSAFEEETELQTVQEHQKRQKRVIDNSHKKHKRIQSIDPNSSSSVVKAGSNKKLTLEPSQSQASKKMKKKCKTQGQESLQKYRPQDLLKSNSSYRLGQTGGFSQKKKLEKENLNNSSSKLHMVKLSNLPDYNYASKVDSMMGMIKKKKLEDKKPEFSLERCGYKKSRLKTHNFF